MPVIVPMLVAMYGWPLDPPHNLTSGFAEFRRNHFHGGIDFSTGQKVGRTVYAVGDGWVWRVRASGSGYGKAVYLRLEDGRTAVYAHLHSFAPTIGDFVEAAQESLERYEVDLHPEPGRLAFSRGDVIAESGESGAGPPHLHFEVRSGPGADVGLNPLRNGFALADTIPPIITRLLIRPWGEEPVRPLLRGGAGRYRVAEEIHVMKGARVSVSAHDPGGNGSRLALNAARLIVDGETRYDLTFDSFDWNSAHQVELAYDPAALEGEPFLLNLYRPPGASNPVFPAGPDHAGWLAIDGPEPMTPGRHDVVIRLADAQENESTLSFVLHLDPLKPSPGSAGGPMKVSVRGGIIHVAVDLNLRREGAEEVHLRTPVGSMRAEVLPGGGGRGEAWIEPPEGIYTPLIVAWSETAETLDVARVTRGDGATLRHGSMTITAPERAFFGPGLLHFREMTSPLPEGELIPVGRSIEIASADVVLDRSVRVAIEPPPGEDADRLSLYRWSGGSWSFVGSDPDRDGIGGTTRYLATFGLFRDETAPVVSIQSPAEAGIETDRPRILARITDRGSGFGWSDIQTAIDGVPQIVVFDPEASTLSGRSRRDLPPGRHTLMIRVTDRAGNTRTVERMFDVSR
jgi:hypothetical protein